MDSEANFLYKNDRAPYKVLAVMTKLQTCSSYTQWSCVKPHEQASVFQSDFSCVFKLLTDNTEHSEEIKTDSIVRTKHISRRITYMINSWIPPQLQNLNRVNDLSDYKGTSNLSQIALKFSCLVKGTVEEYFSPYSFNITTVCLFYQLVINTETLYWPSEGLIIEQWWLVRYNSALSITTDWWNTKPLCQRGTLITCRTFQSGRQQWRKVEILRKYVDMMCTCITTGFVSNRTQFFSVH